MEENKFSTPAQKSKANKLLLVIIISMVLVIAVVVVAAKKSKKPLPVPTTNTEKVEDGSQQTEAELSDYKQEAQVFITAQGVSPETLVIPKDTRIVWENKDTAAHKIAIAAGTKSPPNFFDFRQIDVGGGYPYVIHESTTFHYYVVDHPTQNGTVIVK
jgi:hypothetical protein